MRQISFKTIEKNLQKKNGELVELRDFRKRIGRQRKRNLRRDREIAKRFAKIFAKIFVSITVECLMRNIFPKDHIALA